MLSCCEEGRRGGQREAPLTVGVAVAAGSLPHTAAGPGGGPPSAASAGVRPTRRVAGLAA